MAVVFARQFASPITLILVVAAAVTTVMGEFLDASVIAVAIALNTAIGFTQERRAEKSVRALAVMVAQQARVVRDGRECLIPSRDVVQGDVVLLESGWRVPADLRLVTVTALSVDESLLTGESAPVAKAVESLSAQTALADRRNMAYAGTVVASGRARAVVVATGPETAVGAIAETMLLEPPTRTPLQQRLVVFGRVVAAAVALIAVLAFGIGVLRGETASSMFRVAVAMAVSAVPEGLPVAFTITLALGVRRMSVRNAIVRHLPAVETLGSTTVIGSDKTGTLTENQMTVQQLWTPDETIAFTGRDHTLPISNPARQTLLAGVLANEAELFASAVGYEARGNPTEVALLQSAARCGIQHEDARTTYPPLIEIPFEPERQYSASVRTYDDGNVLFLKGAPERVLDMCSDMLLTSGIVPIDRSLVQEAALAMAGRGLRLLAMARANVALPLPEGLALLPPKGLTFLGMQGMMDPPRAGVREAIDGCRQAGLRVIMITGDHAATASAIAQDLGIARAGDPILTGGQMADMDESEIMEACKSVSVYARVAPDQKLQVVHALRRSGEVVAITGDGVNDAPALKAADIGIAMGKSGTDVARQAADMILADDNFVSIYAAVEEGRVTFDNIRKVTVFLVSTGVAEVIAILAALALGWPLPFLAAQILWLNLVTNGFQDVALAFEPGEPDVLRRPPRDPGEGLLSRLLLERTLVSGVVMAAGTLFAFRWELNHGASESTAQTVALTTMVLFQVFHVGNSRTERQSVFRRSPLSNPFLFLSSAGALAVHVFAIYFPPVRYVLRFEPIPPDVWLGILPLAATVLLAVELDKWLRRASSSRRASVPRRSD